MASFSQSARLARLDHRCRPRRADRLGQALQAVAADDAHVGDAAVLEFGEYTAATEGQARERFEEFGERWGQRYPAIIKLWENAWAEFVPFLVYDAEIRRIVYSTNAIESLHARFRRAVRARGHFPTEDAALKCIYMTIRSLDPTGKGRQRWATRWKPALNAFAMTFEGRLNPNNH